MFEKLRFFKYYIFWTQQLLHSVDIIIFLFSLDYSCIRFDILKYIRTYVIIFWCNKLWSTMNYWNSGLRVVWIYAKYINDHDVTGLLTLTQMINWPFDSQNYSRLNCSGFQIVAPRNNCRTLSRVGSRKWYNINYHYSYLPRALGNSGILIWKGSRVTKF